MLNDFSSGIHFCKRKNIDCYLFSTKNCKFFNYNDNIKTFNYTNNIFPFYTTINYENKINNVKDPKLEQFFHKSNK